MERVKAKFPGKKILLAEDYFVNQEVTQEILQLMECEVEIAENGSEAVNRFEKTHYDLIFMDIQMPVMDGYDATKQIRELEKERGRPTTIVALTANALSGDREKCLEAGMDDYISKPLEAAKLEEILNKYLGDAES